MVVNMSDVEYIIHTVYLHEQSLVCKRPHSMSYVTLSKQFEVSKPTILSKHSEGDMFLPLIVLLLVYFQFSNVFLI